jgi:hypothetical protein
VSAVANFSRWLDLLLPGGGYVVALAEVYMDESYDGTDEPPYIHVAGYLFRKQKAKEFARAWSNHLTFKKLDYFHMAECAPGNGIFKKLGKQGRIDLGRKLIELTHAYTTFGFAVTVHRADYEQIVGAREGMPDSAYAFALFVAMMRVRDWTEKMNFSGKISYVFEAGHDDKGKADAFMKWMFASERIALNHSYGGHAFLPKETPGLHPADMLAGHGNAEVTRRHDPNRRPVRKDFEALVREQDFAVEYDLPALQGVATSLQIAEERRAEIIRQVEAGERDISDLPPPTPAR